MSIVAKQTMPAPAQFLAQFTMPYNAELTKEVYPNEEDLVDLLPVRSVISLPKKNSGTN